ncbi:MAG: hypothetical protein NC489_25820 [Ruminococcus flavefaciens]|nr:hypothetical protein [Ruminococcus flavefaciens]
MSKEIERQFAMERDLVFSDMENALNTIAEKSGKSCKITAKYTEDQYTSYLYTDPVQIRVRKVCTGKKTRYETTVKGGYETKTTRTEVNVRINEEQYNAILSLIGDHKPIHKACTVVKYDGYEINISTVDPGEDTSFTFAEVEFASEEEAAAFVWPFTDIEVTEVTGGVNSGAPVGKSMSMPDYWVKTRLGKSDA